MPLDTENEITKEENESQWPWPDPLKEYNREKAMKNLRRLAKDTFFVSLSLFLLFSWFEWRSPGAVSNYFNLGILFFFFLFFLTVYQTNWIKEKTLAQKKKIAVVAQYGFLISLALATLGSLNFLFIQKIIFLQNIINFLKPNNFYTAGLAIFFGFLAFWLERDRIEKEFGEDEEKEKLEEEKRKNEFPQKFPKINKVPIIKKIARKMHLAGWKYSFGLILILVLFIATRLYFVLSNNVTISDDWYSIISAEKLIEENDFLYRYGQDIPYIRGLYVIFMTAFYFILFGKSVLVAKLVPLTIGIINFFLILGVTKKLEYKKITRVFILLVFTFFPWTIFNHIFIRMYVFYEMFLLMIFLTTFLMMKSIENKKKLSLLLWFMTFVLINSINWFFSHDEGKYLVALCSTITLIYMFLAESQQIKISSHNCIARLIKKIFELEIHLKVLVVAIALFVGYFVMGIKKNIIWFLKAKTNTPENHLDFYDIFFNLNYLFSVLFIIGIVLLFFSKKKYGKYISIVGIILFFTHYISNRDLQIVRGMMYFFPLYFIISFYLVNEFFRRRIIKGLAKIMFLILFSILLFLIIEDNYPRRFMRDYPLIPNELAYFNFEDSFEYIKNNKQNKILIASAYSIFQSEYFDVKFDYMIDFNEILEKSRTVYYDKNIQKYKILPGDIPLIKEKTEFMELCEKNECLIFAHSYSPKHFFDEEINNYLRNNYKVIEDMQGVIIYD